MPNILGKSLCGPDFFLDLARFGYTLEMPKTILALNESNKTMARGIKNERMGTQMKEGIYELLDIYLRKEIYPYLRISNYAH